MPGLRAFSRLEFMQMIEELHEYAPAVMVHVSESDEMDDYALEIYFPEDVYEEHLEILEDLSLKNGYETFV